MQYLTYEEYKDIGGALDVTAFNRNIDRASAMIDMRTQNRLEDFEEIPSLVKAVCADLVDYVSTTTVNKGIASVSQSAGGVSESISYVVKSSEDFATDLDNIFEPLKAIVTKNGFSLLYEGARN